MPAPISVMRPARLVTPALDHELHVGAHTCSPLLPYEMLHATSIISPSSYERAVREGLTLERTAASARRGGVINASPAIRLSRLITLDPHGYDIFGLSGINLADTMRQRIPSALGFATSLLPRRMRIRLAMSVMQKQKHHFVGSRTSLRVQREGDHLYVGVIDSIFSGREDTLIGGSELERRAIESLFREFARVPCRVVQISPTNSRLNESWFEIVQTKS